MSTWISEPRARRGAVWAALVVLLTGCLETEIEPQPEMTRAALGAGAVQLTTPRGYCIDEGSLRRTGGGGGVAIVASCESLTGTPGLAVEPALMTVSVLPRDVPAPAPVAARLSAAVAPAPVGATGEADGLAYAQVLEGGAAILPGGDPKHWRGARVVGDRLVGLAVYMPAGSPLAGEEGRRLLSALAAGLAARPDTGASQQTGPRPGFLSWLTSGRE